MKKSRLALACSLYGVAFLVVIFGLDLSLRTILVVGVAVALWLAGNAVWKQAMPTGPFQRFQFRIDLHHLGQAYLDAGIYQPGAIPMEDIRSSMLGKGQIIFTWLERGLLYLNTHNGFNSELEFSIYLRTFRNGEEVWDRRGDELEMRKTETGYELVLIASETIEKMHPRPYQYPGTVLFHLPYSLFSALQGPDSYYRRFDRAKAIMEAVPGIKFRLIEEVRDGWDFENRYGDFRWWQV